MSEINMDPHIYFANIIFNEIRRSATPNILSRASIQLQLGPEDSKIRGFKRLNNYVDSIGLGSPTLWDGGFNPEDAGGLSSEIISPLPFCRQS